MSKMNVEFSPESSALLARMADSLGTTKAGALRLGLSLLAIATRETAAGNSIGVIRGERVVKEIAGVWAAVEGEKVPA